MSVLDNLRPKGWRVEHEIRILLRAYRKQDVSTAACKQFARELIQSLYPTWQPGDALSHEQAQRIGGEFDRLLLKKRDDGWKVSRLEQPPFKHRDEMTPQDWRTYRRRVREDK